MSFSVLQLVRVRSRRWWLRSQDGGLWGPTLPHLLSAYYVTGTVLAACMLSRFSSVRLLQPYEL